MQGALKEQQITQQIKKKQSVSDYCIRSTLFLPLSIASIRIDSYFVVPSVVSWAVKTKLLNHWKAR